MNDESSRAGRHRRRAAWSCGLAAVVLSCWATAAQAHAPHACPPDLPETPALAEHLEQRSIDAGEVGFDQLFAHGRALFVAKFNLCDGQGRPAATGIGEKRAPDEPAFIRTSGPDANACSGCHIEPRVGGAGEFVVNVFVLSQVRDPVITSVRHEFSNERNTLGMFGAGAIEMLGREMTADLRRQADGLADGDWVLTSKGVDFPVTVSHGEVVASEGVDPDLVIKPFHQAGVKRSLRQFTVDAMIQHPGMLAEEGFGLNPDKGREADFDEDGVERELTVGDITAISVFQAALGVPGRRLPLDPEAAISVARGERRFADIGCTGCHVPAMRLEDRRFVEPYALNPPGFFGDPERSVAFDMTREGEGPYLEPRPEGGAIVRAYTDLKRHNLCDPPGMAGAIRHFCNEYLDQGRPDQGELPGSEFFITRKLWDAGNSAPYGHRGDLITLTEAIRAHGGEGRPSRDAFVALPLEERRAIIAFLKSLQVLPAGSPRLVVEP
ncbi:di-heme oxidoredictase family protein [Halomonas beimenensis]|uniref:Thiol oxidoreductase n=1 Tax=Halomonas beimenensis TaxID=475662 RepID=A0A291PCA7_9GAMM|nr:di-heme oxidoredictase family protein [Halomonas beimenensis]ATJ84546.1 hypothetical protein BEI_3559 [Halomonas beimenensis]